MSVKDGGPAFPVETYGDGRGMQTGPDSGWETGMTLRDYFAAQALSAIISGSAFPTIHGLADEAGVDSGEYMADAAYEYADAMLKARAK
jgi:hypothetical protein